MTELEHSNYDRDDDRTKRWFVCPVCEGTIRPSELRIQTIKRADGVSKRRYGCPECNRSDDKNNWVLVTVTGEVPADP
jgi:hypothetical protein